MLLSTTIANTIIYTASQTISYADPDIISRAQKLKSIFEQTLIKRELSVQGGIYVSHCSEKNQPFMPTEERCFWRNSLVQFADFSLSERPFRYASSIQEHVVDTAWRMFVLSRHPDCDLFLYSRTNACSYPLIVIFNEGQILFLDTNALSISNTCLTPERILQNISGGSSCMVKWIQEFEKALIKKPVSPGCYAQLLRLFSQINQLAQPVSSNFSDAIQLYETDINILREKNRLLARPVFNDNGIIMIQDKEALTVFYTIELYSEKELPRLIYSIIRALLDKSIDTKLECINYEEVQKKIGELNEGELGIHTEEPAR